MKILQTAKKTEAKEPIFFDTEFYENGELIVPISFGFVKGLEGNNHLYLVNEDFDEDFLVEDTRRRGTQETREFLYKSVLGKNLDATDKNTFPLSIIREKIVTFVGSNPVFWASNADYDWVLLMQLFGPMMKKPKHWEQYSAKDTNQLKGMFPNVLIHAEYMPDVFIFGGSEHNALYDAYDTRNKYLCYKDHVEKYKIPVVL